MGFPDMCSMKSLGLVVFLILPMSYAQTSERWKLVNQNLESKIWILKSNSEVTSAYQTSVPDTRIDWSKIELKKIFKNYQSNKERSLKVIGIRDLKIANYDWKKTPFGHELVAYGSYVNQVNKKILFQETQIFQTNKTYQILNTWPASLEEGKFFAIEFVHGLRAGMEEI